MQDVDDIRGFARKIQFSPTGEYTTGGGVALTNCVIEIVENDWQGHCPMLSMRFYDTPYPHELAEEMAAAGNPAYDEDAPIGVELSLGPELARSLVEQIQTKWPEFMRTIENIE